MDSRGDVDLAVLYLCITNHPAVLAPGRQASNQSINRTESVFGDAVQLEREGGREGGRRARLDWPLEILFDVSRPLARLPVPRSIGICSRPVVGE